MVLEKIMADNLLELETRKRSLPLSELRRVVGEQSPTVSLASFF